MVNEMITNPTVDVEKLDWHVDNGNVRVSYHNTEPLNIYCYTSKCVGEQAWDDVTRIARGLVLRRDTNEVVAKGFDKFFNLHEHALRLDDSGIGPVNLIPPFRVYDKADGSLGLSYARPSDGKIQWATKGSFHSEQAEWANRFWERYENVQLPTLAEDGVQVLAEIVYPDNRIVLDYGDTETLVLLACLNRNGTQIYPDAYGTAPYWWPLDVVGSFGEHDTLPNPDDRDNSEGYIVLSNDGKSRVKMKNEEYLRLHGLMTGLTNKKLWQGLCEGASFVDLHRDTPEEFSEWVTETLTKMQKQFNDIYWSTRAEYHNIVASLGGHENATANRKLFADKALATKYPSLMFSVLDGKNTDQMIWKLVEPKETTSPFMNGETQ